MDKRLRRTLICNIVKLHLIWSKRRVPLKSVQCIRKYGFEGGKKSKEILLALNEMSYLEGRWDKKDMKSNQGDFKLAIMK